MEVHASLKAEDILVLGPVGITNSMLMAWIAVVLLGVVAWLAGRNPQLVPRGLQNAFEMVVEGLLGLAEATAGHYARRVFPLIATIFIFILVSNYMGLLPGVGTITIANPHYHGDGSTTHAAPAAPGIDLGGALVRTAEAAPQAAPAPADPPPGAATSGTDSEAHELPTVPLFRASNADINMTLGMGLIAFLFIHGSGIYVHGLVGYIRDDLFKPLLLGPVKIIIELFVPVSLSMRLFGNVFGGEMLLTVVNFPVVALPFMVLELLFGFIQALIFTMLTLIFTSLATQLIPGHGDHAAHAPSGAHGGEAAGGHGEHGRAPAATPIAATASLSGGA